MRPRLLLVPVLLSASTLRAQTVQGFVRRPDGSPAAYVVVTATADGDQQARALTDARGAYRIELPAPLARYRLRALQVGWLPTEGATLGPFASESTTVEAPPIIMIGTPVQLPAISVRTADVCGARARDGAAVSAVWEQARTALLASRLRADTAGRDTQLRTEWMEYERELDADGTRVRRQSQSRTAGMTARAFTSIAAESLAVHGYVVDTPDGTIFHAPDADVLLSASFAASHCFSLEPAPPEQPSWIGVAFRPARTVSGKADVLGSLWLDRRSGELRALHFRYVNLPAAATAAEPGGAVRFLHLETGEWLVGQWSIRMPLVAARAGRVSIGPRTLVVTPVGRTLAGVQIAGGEVLRVVRGQSALFEGEGATLEVRTAAGDGTHATSMLHAALEGTDYEFTSDRRGVARVRPVLPGSYQLRITSALMDSLGLQLPPMPITIGEDGRVVEVALPPASELRRAVCGDAPPGQSLLRGVVRDRRGQPVAGALLRLRPLQDSTASAGDARVILNDDALRLQTDSAGAWRLCSVPTGTPMMVYAASPIGTHDTLFTAGTELEALNLTLARRDVAQLVVRVIDDRQRPLRDVVADVTALGGEAFTLRTDAAGRTIAHDLPRGTARVRLRAVGFQEGTVTIELAPGLNEVPVLLDPAASPTLDTVRVSATRLQNTRFSDFERRRAAGVPTATIDEEEIERRAPVSTFQLFTRLPGVMLIDSLGSWYAKSRREKTVTCFIRVAVDGRVLPDARTNLALLPSPKEVHGIEFFAGPARIPPELYSAGTIDNGRSFCGLIAIWTR